MRIWFITGFGLTIVGCWILILGIQDRLEQLGRDQQDSTVVTITNKIDLTDDWNADFKSGTSAEGVDKMDENFEIAASEKSSRSESRDKFAVINNLAFADLDSLLPDNAYHEILVSKLIEDGWDVTQLRLLAQYLSDPRTEFLPEVLKINATHVENWEQYSHHLTSDGFEMCRKYWSKHNRTISSAAEEYNFPPPIIMAILKVETNFGKYKGRHSVFNVFWSLSLGDNQQVKGENMPELGNMKKPELKKLHRRARWARLQLADLLYTAKSGGENPVGIMGSWAGAFGLCQFIPASYRAYGRDGNGDSVIDLDNVADASASIANYLIENGWHNNGSRAKQKRSIMRYNHSEYYADCVLQLADGIEKQWQGLAAID